MVLSRTTEWSGVPEGVKPVLLASYVDNTVVFEMSNQHPFLIGADDDFWRLMNAEAPEGLASEFGFQHVFKNVWDRKTLFLHASFVTDTTAGYLGRGGEFYPKPSKMYRHGNYSDFFIETSLDGYHKVPLPYENWIIELSLILDADEYQSP
jgi:hypothetical protein